MTGTNSFDLQIINSQFKDGANIDLSPKMTATDTIIQDNSFDSPGRGSRASNVLTSATALQKWSFDFCDSLVFDNITSVRHSFTQLTQPGAAPSFYPVSVAAYVEPCDDPTQNKRVSVYLSEASAGTMVIDVDSVTYVNSPGAKQ